MSENPVTTWILANKWTFILLFGVVWFILMEGLFSTHGNSPGQTLPFYQSVGSLMLGLAFGWWLWWRIEVRQRTSRYQSKDTRRERPE